MISSDKYGNLPHESGVYLFYDKNQKLLYIGKAKDLKKRVSQYFINKNHDLKTRTLVKKIVFIDFLITKSERESILVEQNLISENWPPYNIQFKDNKSFPVIIITRESYPRIYLSRQYNKDKGDRFGPYLSMASAKVLFQFVLENFKIRTCQKKLIKPSTPCLNYHIGQCEAPCARYIDQESYLKNIRDAKTFLRGNFIHLLHLLKEKIEKNSREHNFEKALEYKQKYENINQFKNQFSYNFVSRKITDFIAVYCDRHEGVITLLRMKDSRKIYSLTRIFEFSDYPVNVFPELIYKLYREFFSINYESFPEELYLPFKVQDQYILEYLGFLENQIAEIKAKNTVSENDDGIGFSGEDQGDEIDEGLSYGSEDTEQIKSTRFEVKGEILQNIAEFSGKYGQKVSIHNYKTRKEIEILKQLVKHCRTFYRETYLKPGKKEEEALKGLKLVLKLKKIPRIIEGFDISNFSSKVIVGSSVRFTNGLPDKKNYRHYKLKTVEYQNDVASITEIVVRRVTHYLNNKTKLPDILLIDGGKPQVNSVYAVLQKLNLKPIIVGLAKKEELLIFPDKQDPLKLEIDSKELRLLMNIRDEAHRFANRYREMKQNNLNN